MHYCCIPDVRKNDGAGGIALISTPPPAVILFDSFFRKICFLFFTTSCNHTCGCTCATLVGVDQRLMDRATAQPTATQRTKCAYQMETTMLLNRRLLCYHSMRNFIAKYCENGEAGNLLKTFSSSLAITLITHRHTKMVSISHFRFTIAYYRPQETSVVPTRSGTGSPLVWPSVSVGNIIQFENHWNTIIKHNCISVHMLSCNLI